MKNFLQEAKKRVGEVTAEKQYKLDRLLHFSLNKNEDFNLRFDYNYSRITFLVCSQPHDIWMTYGAGG